MEQNSTIEVTKPMCNCGNEIGQLQYYYSAEKSFNDFLDMFDVEFDSSEFFLSKEDLKKERFCCQVSLITGFITSISIFQTTDAKRIFPETLEGPIGEHQKLTWYE